MHSFSINPCLTERLTVPLRSFLETIILYEAIHQEFHAKSKN